MIIVFNKTINNICGTFRPCHRLDAHRSYINAEKFLALRKNWPGKKRVCEEASRQVETYKKGIIILIPDARRWPSKYWLDEKHIFDELQRVYNVDYRSNNTDYFCLTCLLANAGTLPSRSNSWELFFLCNLKSFSIGLAEAIWNACDDSTYVKLLCLAEKRAERLDNGSVSPKRVTGVKAVGDITYTRLCQSWLFKYVQQRLNEGAIDPRYIKKARKAIFDISMRASDC